MGGFQFITHYIKRLPRLRADHAYAGNRYQHQAADDQHVLHHRGAGFVEGLPR